MHDVVRTLVYSASGTSVRTVLVDGQIVVRDGAVRTVDERHVLDRSREAAERVVHRAGLKPESRWLPT